MFYPQEMTEIELIVPEGDALAVTGALAERGVFHQTDASYLGSETGSDSADDWREKSATYATLERQLLVTMKALGVEEGSPPSPDLVSMVQVEAVRPAAERLEQEVERVVEELADKQKELEQLQGYIQQLEPIADVDVEVSALRNLHYVFSMLGTMPVDNVERLGTSLARIPSVLLTLRQDNRQAVVLLLGTRQNADILERAARSAYLNPLNLPDDYRGTPRVIIEALSTDVRQIQRRIAEQKSTVTELRETRGEQLQTLLWRVRASRMLSDAMARSGRLRYTYLIVGWVPSSGLADLTQRLKQASGEILMEVNPSKRGSVEQNVPVALHNPKALRPFQQLVLTFARPRYNELDPTILIAVTFPLLFGAMFGDVGHGLELALLGVLLTSRKVKALRSLASLGRLVTVCGVVASLFGFLYGSIFGVENVLPAFWIRPIENIMQILYISIGAGIVLLSAGFLINIFNAGMTRDWGRLLFDHNGIAGLVLYWSLIGLAAGAFLGSLPFPPLVFIVLAVVAGPVVMFSEALRHLIEGHRPLVEGGLGTYAIQVFFEMFETLIGFLSNSLSYVRVGAFAVAHAGLSAVFFILAELVSPGHSVGYWIMVVLGNLFIIGFEGLIVGIQTMRLEYYEFFSKFFMGGGMRYKPLTLLPTADE
jgi:V/A-type H+-transporting ATPase subunit I